MKKRNKQFLREKEFIRLKKELDENYRAQTSLGYIELEKPIFIGYHAKIELRADISYREDAWLFEAMIEQLGTEVYAKYKTDFDFTSGKYRKRKVQTRPRIRNISEKEYEGLIAEAKKWFQLKDYDTFESGLNGWYRGRTYVCIVPSFWFDIVYEKVYKTRVPIIDEVLKQEEAEIESRINSKFFIDRWQHSVPKSFRRKLNKSTRTKSKRTLYNIVNKGMDEEFNDNYKDAAWRYW